MKKQESDKVSLREALQLSRRAFGMWVKKYPFLLVSSAAYTIVQAAIPYAGLYFSARIVNELAGNRDPGTLVKWVWISLLSLALLGLLQAGLSRWKNYQHSGFFYKRNQFYTDKLLDMDFSSLDEQRTHDLRSQIAQDENWSDWGAGKVVGIFESAVKSLTSILGAAALTVSLFALPVPESGGWIAHLNSPCFVLLMIAVMLAAAFVAPMCTNKATQYVVRYANRAKLSNRVFNYFISNVVFDHARALDIRIYRQDKMVRQYVDQDRSFTPDSPIARAARGPMGMLDVLSSLISTCFTGVVYLFVCLKAWGGAFGVGSVTQYIGAITSLSSGISSLIHVLGLMRANAFFLRTTFAFMDIPNRMYQGSLTVEKRSDCNYEIEFRDVSFRYPGAQTDSLRHVSLKFRIGERLAIVGQNGSGKTTFIKLLCRLYDPSQGQILLNGIDIRKYNYQEYMSIFSIVFQDFKLLAFQLGQNVAASGDYDRTKAEACLKEAGFDKRLQSLPEGLDTYLYRGFEEKGVEISGGEAQKIALARALYKKSPIIILDEPTAALDPIAEYEVYSKFNEIIGEKTAIYISHRLSSCRFCDDIVVFDRGSVIQQGTHDELVADKEGKYYELWEAQAQYYQ